MLPRALVDTAQTDMAIYSRHLQPPFSFRWCLNRVTLATNLKRRRTARQIIKSQIRSIGIGLFPNVIHHQIVLSGVKRLRLQSGVFKLWRQALKRKLWLFVSGSYLWQVKLQTLRGCRGFNRSNFLTRFFLPVNWDDIFSYCHQKGFFEFSFLRHFNT